MTAGERIREKENIVVGTGTVTTILRLSTAYMSNQRTTTMDVMMMTTVEIWMTWRRRDRRRTMTTTMA